MARRTSSGLNLALLGGVRAVPATYRCTVSPGWRGAFRRAPGSCSFLNPPVDLRKPPTRQESRGSARAHRRLWRHGARRSGDGAGFGAGGAGGSRLAERGHPVTLQTWSRWREPVEALGMAFSPAPEYHVFPTRARPLKPYEAVVRAATDTRPLVAEARPDVLVADILTLAPALAGELEGVPVATLIPHVFPPSEPEFPPYSFGARLPRTPLGRAAWRLVHRPVDQGLARGRDELNETRARLGLEPVDEVHGG